MRDYKIYEINKRKIIKVLFLKNLVEEIFVKEGILMEAVKRLLSSVLEYLKPDKSTKRRESDYVKFVRTRLEIEAEKDELIRKVFDDAMADCLNPSIFNLEALRMYVNEKKEDDEEDKNVEI